jgi:hypothetical protein
VFITKSTKERLWKSARRNRFLVLKMAENKIMEVEVFIRGTAPALDPPLRPFFVDCQKFCTSLIKAAVPLAGILTQF